MNENTSPKKRDHLSAFISNQNKSKKLIKDDLGAFISYEYIYKKNYENTSKKTMKVHLKKNHLGAFFLNRSTSCSSPPHHLHPTAIVMNYDTMVMQHENYQQC